MANKFKVSEGLRVQSTDVIDNTGSFVGLRLLPTSTNASTSVGTGALVVQGGAGISGSVAIGGAIYAGGVVGTAGQALLSTGTGIQWATLSGGGAAFNGGTITTALTITDATVSVSATTGALIVTGGAGIGGDLYADNIYSNGVLLAPSSGGLTRGQTVALARGMALQ